MNKPKRIHIIGSVGSGKTTLARMLSSKLGTPFYELDNVVWGRSEHGDKIDVRNTPEERDRQFQNIVNSDGWIIEGVHHEWVSQGFCNAEMIIFLDTNFTKRIYRIIRRFILQRLGLEKANYEPTFKVFMKMFKWNRLFENESKPEILNMLEPFHNKLVILKDNVEEEKVIKWMSKEI